MASLGLFGFRFLVSILISEIRRHDEKRRISSHCIGSRSSSSSDQAGAMHGPCMTSIQVVLFWKWGSRGGRIPAVSEDRHAPAWQSALYRLFLLFSPSPWRLWSIHIGQTTREHIPYSRVTGWTYGKQRVHHYSGTMPANHPSGVIS